mgnify:CR=1 FL=1
MKDLSKSVIFQRGNKLPEQSANNFQGTSYLNMIVPFESELGCPIGNVTFEPGSRNYWHKHPGGKILLVTGGRGWYQEEGKGARELQAGDAVEIPCNVKHWHGAAKDSWFVHLAIEANMSAGAAEWLEKVSDEEYNKLK